MNYLITAAGVLGALAVITTATRHALRGLVDMVDLVRSLLQLQPRVVELAEQIAAGLDEMRTWRQTYESRLTRLEVLTSHPQENQS